MRHDLVQAQRLLRRNKVLRAITILTANPSDEIGAACATLSSSHDAVTAAATRLVQACEADTASFEATTTSLLRRAPVQRTIAAAYPELARALMLDGDGPRSPLPPHLVGLACALLLRAAVKCTPFEWLATSATADIQIADGLSQRVGIGSRRWTVRAAVDTSSEDAIEFADPSWAAVMPTLAFSVEDEQPSVQHREAVRTRIRAATTALVRDFPTLEPDERIERIAETEARWSEGLNEVARPMSGADREAHIRLVVHETAHSVEPCHVSLPTRTVQLLEEWIRATLPLSWAHIERRLMAAALDTARADTQPLLLSEFPEFVAHLNRSKIPPEAASVVGSLLQRRSLLVSWARTLWSSDSPSLPVELSDLKRASHEPEAGCLVSVCVHLQFAENGKVFLSRGRYTPGLGRSFSRVLTLDPKLARALVRRLSQWADREFVQLPLLSRYGGDPNPLVASRWLAWHGAPPPYGAELESGVSPKALVVGAEGAELVVREAVGNARLELLELSSADASSLSTEGRALRLLTSAFSFELPLKAASAPAHVAHLPEIMLEGTIVLRRPTSVVCLDALPRQRDGWCATVSALERFASEEGLPERAFLHVCGRGDIELDSPISSFSSRRGLPASWRRPRYVDVSVPPVARQLLALRQTVSQPENCFLIWSAFDPGETVAVDGDELAVELAFELDVQT